MSALHDTVDPGGLAEFSVVFTDRSLNHMSANFQQVMRDLSAMLRQVYAAEGVAIVPGGGSYAMEAVARQFARDARVLVVRNGWFSYRWSQILETGGIAGEATVMKARRTGNAAQSPFVPAPVEEQLKLSPYINQIMIEGTGCPYNVAVIVVDDESLREFADGEGIDYESTEDLLDEPRIRKLFADELETWGEEVKSYELPEDFVLTAEEFSTDNEMLTPTLKLKRRNILAEYGDALSRLYDDSVPIGKNAA